MNERLCSVFYNHNLNKTFGWLCPEGIYLLLLLLLPHFGWAHDSPSGDHGLWGLGVSGCFATSCAGCRLPRGELQAAAGSEAVIVEC